MKSRLPQLLEALAFAAHKHREQRRKDVKASPYINHPIALANVLVREGGISDIDVLCAALLHDTIEDTMTTPKELVDHFGEEIAAIVVEVTDNKMLKKHTRKKMQVEHAGRASAKARLVKLADKICNLRDLVARPPAGWDLKSQQEYFDWARRVIDRLRGTHPRLEAAFDRAYRQRPKGR